MREPQESRTVEQALRKRVARALAAHKAITANCYELFRALENIHSCQSLRTIDSIPLELRKSSEHLRYALDCLSRFLLQEIVSLDRDNKPLESTALHRESQNPDSCTPLPSAPVVTGKRTHKENVGARAELARFRTRLAERDLQIAELINDGLRLAFKKEALEERIAELLVASGPPIIHPSTRPVPARDTLRRAECCKMIAAEANEF